MAQLTLVNLSQLRLGTRHAGKLLIVRTLCEARDLVMSETAIEDTTGEVDNLQAVNYGLGVSAAEHLPRGAVFAIKEPYYKVTMSGGYAVRVDHPTDLVPLPNNHSLMPATFYVLSAAQIELDADAYRVAGNNAYKSGDMLAALKQYSDGIVACSEEEVLLKGDLLRNRCMVHLRLNRYEPAITDAQSSLELADHLAHPDDTASIAKRSKALFRAGRAFYNLRRFCEAEDHLRQASHAVPADLEVVGWLQRAQKRVLESRTGDIDFRALDRSCSMHQPHIDCADFSSRIEIRSAGHRGHGVFARQDLKMGDLILCERAFAMGPVLDRSVPENIFYDTTTSRLYGTEHNGLMKQALDKIRHNPSLGRTFFSMLGAAQESDSAIQRVAEDTVVNVFTLHQLLYKNKSICSLKSPPTMFPYGQLVDPPDTVQAIWLNAFRFNHQCDANATCNGLRDAIIFRATKDIKSGEEITITYLGEDRFSGVSDTNTINRELGFTCDCKVCQLESGVRRRTSTQREILLESIMRHYIECSAPPLSQTQRRAIERACTQLEQTYDAHLYRSKPRRTLPSVYSILAVDSHLRQDWHTALNQAMLYFESAGYRISTEHNRLVIDSSRAIVGAVAVDVAYVAASVHHHLGNAGLGTQFDQLTCQFFLLFHGFAMPDP